MIIPASHSWDAVENEHTALEMFYNPQGAVCRREDDYQQDLLKGEHDAELSAKGTGSHSLLSCPPPPCAVTAGLFALPSNTYLPICSSRAGVLSDTSLCPLSIQVTSSLKVEAQGM